MSNITTAGDPNTKSSYGGARLVLDTFERMTQMIDNDVVPGSAQKSDVVGNDNPSSTLGSSENSYTTLSLKPKAGNVLDVRKSYINFRAPFKFVLTGATKDFPAAEAAELGWELIVFLDGTNMLYDKRYVMIGESNITSTTYSREEAMVVIDSLPEPYLYKNPNFTTIQNIIDNKKWVGGRWDIGALTAGQTKTFLLNMDMNIDLEMFHPAFSNIPFITPEFGDLKIRPYFDNMNKAFKFMVHHKGTNEYIALPVGGLNDKRVFKFEHTSTTPISGYLQLTEWGSGMAAETGYTQNEHTGTICQMCQSCFTINETSRQAIKELIAENGNLLIIPTVNLSTQRSTQVPSPASTEAVPQTFVFNASFQNVNSLNFLFPYRTYSNVFYPNPRLSSINATINGVALNATIYKLMDNRLIKQCIQTLLDDDYLSVSEDYLGSLQYLVNGNSNIEYSKAVWTEVYGEATNRVQPKVQLAHRFCLPFNCNPPNSFRKGYMTVRESGSGSSQIVLNCQTGGTTGFGDNALFANYEGAYAQQQVAGAAANDTIQPLCVAVSDCAIVFKYDVGAREATSATFEYAG